MPDGKEYPMAKRKFIGGIVDKLLSTESEWNPKVAAGRVAERVLPERWLFAFKKVYYPRLLRRSGVLPEPDAEIVRHLVSTGDHVIDVGASIGQYTKFLADSVGPNGLVYSFEPLPPTFEILTSCVRKLRLNRIELFNCAISDADGSTVMLVPLYRWGSECYYDARIAGGNENNDLRRFQVAKRAIDSIFRDHEDKISFIKCDVNYHELSFVRGSLNTIQRFKPAMLVEVGTNPDGSIAEKVLAILREQEYEAYHFDGKKLHPRSPGVRNQNWFFLRPPHVALLSQRCPQLLAI
jgi:FkbM family methyltransferase